MNSPILRPARADDLPRMTRLLEDSSLSPEGMADFLEHFHVADEGMDLVGMVGVEHYGSEGLLRSLAVASSQRSRGIGILLLNQAIEDARRLGMRRLVLLTTTSAEYFGRHGWRTIDRASVTGRLTSSSQFRGACPATATCMEMVL
jgi:amino-acid N-acetyltransferase